MIRHGPGLSVEARDNFKETGEQNMETKARKPANIWLRLTVFGALIVGLIIAYVSISTSGRSYFPSISLTGNRSYTLRVLGGDGLRFCGTISVKMADGRIASHSVEGVAPETFELFGRSISVALNKCEENGSLKVEIASNNKTAVQGTTTGSYGRIDLAAN
jgi:hypothetical protein